ncbi:hypothetical protein [Amycolatopsis anabasis]|uniref:hypothetical protein n=1 Tax=Amycolatopsis anabasis TaxID=1840409 RepID=UPI00131DEF9B|nr:hypothetical protein [Amycolatopsis anabasis]
MGKFEDRLLTDLLTEYRPTLNAAKQPEESAAPRASRRPLWIAAGVLGLVGTATAGAVLLGGGSPAYAVTKDANGEVTVRLRDASGIDGANQELREQGVPAVVVPIKPGCTDIGELPVDKPTGRMTAQAQTQNGEIVFQTKNVPPGDTVVVTAEGNPASRLTLGMLLVKGAPPDCVSVPAGPGTNHSDMNQETSPGPQLNTSEG